jgi:glucoamylase
MQQRTAAAGFAELANHPKGKGRHAVADIVSPDALALVRFGLRAAHDARIVDTVKVIDHLLRVELPGGPCWYRYRHDGYGEHADGQPYDGVGIGRLWPLLTGERAHYELAAGNRAEAERLLQAMESFANDSGLMPEQIWDADDLPEQGLFRGRPTGSATPLVWAHAEYLKLCRSIQDGRVIDLPAQSVERYVHRDTVARHVLWRPEQRWRSVPHGKVVRLEFAEPMIVRWRVDGSEPCETSTSDTTLGVHKLDLTTEQVSPGARVQISWRPQRDRSAEPGVGEFEIGNDPTWSHASDSNRSELALGAR